MHNNITICHGDAPIFFGSTIRKENKKQRAVK
jgi:hypothetical protein